jgi:hypothetical protein
LNADLAFERRTCRAKLDIPGLITDNAIHRYSAPRLERFDRSFRAWIEGAINHAGRRILNSGGAGGEHSLQTFDDFAGRNLL